MKGILLICINIKSLKNNKFKMKFDEDGYTFNLNRNGEVGIGDPMLPHY